VAELSDPAQLWDTAYGRSIVYKLLLLCPVAFLALRNRRVLTALRTVKRPNAPTLRMVRRAVAAELTLALGIVVVASVLVAQVPGRV
jgi:putative copper export protein